MRQGLVALLSTLVAVLAIEQISSAQRPDQNPQPPNLSIQATTLAQLRTWDAFVTSESRAGSLRLRRTDRDPMLPARVVERFEQFHQGVRIWGADVVRDSERGVPLSVFGELASPDLQLSVDPALSEDDARAALLRLGGPDALLLGPPELVISRLDSGEHRLAYTGVVSGNGDVVRAFVDAQTGAELMRYTEIQRQQAVGTGTGVLGDRKKLSVDGSAGNFLASDKHRPPTLQTFDMQGNLPRTKLLFNGLLPYSVSDVARDSDNVWTDVSVVDAHAHVGLTYDYYFKRFGRSGLDSHNAPINIVVNAVTQQGALSLGTADIGYAVNAFWCGTCGPGRQGVVHFGSGIPPGFVMSNGNNYTYFSGSLDIVAHELTHAVTDATSNLVYRNESGALNEAFSDMMGKSVEFSYHPPGSGVGQADYVIGKDISRALRAGSINGDRSMANPGLYGDPDHYSKYLGTTGDNGGVHTNSGIPNHAFYLAIEGGTNRTSGLAVQGVGAGNREQIEKVFYRAFATLLPSSATFVTARAATIQAAGDLYGAGGAVERAVTQAWTAVGVSEAASLGTLSGTVSPDALSTATVTMNASGVYAATLSWASPASIDLDLYLTRAGCPVTQDSCVLVSSDSPDSLESITWPVRAGEQYWLTVHNYSGGATAFTIQHSIAGVSGAISPSAVSVDTVFTSHDSGGTVSK